MNMLIAWSNTVLDTSLGHLKFKMFLLPKLKCLSLSLNSMVVFLQYKNLWQLLTANVDSVKQSNF